MPDMTQLTIEQAMKAAQASGQAGRFSEAESIYGQILAAQPNHPDALHLLGVVIGQAGRVDEATELIRRAISFAPGNAGYHCDLGNFLQMRGQTDDAIASFERALTLKPDYAEAHYNLAIAFKSKGDLDKCLASNQQAVALNGEFVEAYNNLGLAWKDKGQYDRAIECYRRAVQLRPGYAEAHSNLGVALRDTGRVDEAIASHQWALALRPGNPQSHNNLGVALRDRGQIDQAIACFEQALAEEPRLIGANSNLGNAWKASGQIDRAIACFGSEMAIRPDFVVAHDNLLGTMLYDPDSDAAVQHAECQRWNSQFVQPLRRFLKPHANNRDPARRLRIGYVSGDFYDHASAFFLLPLFRHHDRQQFDVTCYAQVTKPDGYTQQMRDHVDGWRSTVGLSDAQIAALVREDRIDILVDLKLHTDNNRLLVFAHKPAPVQVTWLGYPGTTGMDTIDYRLTDPYLDPPGCDESVYFEKSIRLPDTFWCYDPLGDEPQVDQLPCAVNEFVTFGCLNNFCKVNDG
jgi:protein O-GlcNAc transferase